MPLDQGFGLCAKGGVPMTVPEEFWMGESKLLWQAAHVEEIYQCFPTIHLSMANHLNSSQEFSLAIVPQVSSTQPCTLHRIPIVS